MGKLFEELKERGLLYQTSDEEGLQKLLNGPKMTVYSGVDPTMDSLHVGHCVPYTILRRFQKAGHRVIILVGGATCAIGDPSGKDELRKMVSKQQIEENVKGIQQNIETFLDFTGENPAIIVNNADWYKDYAYIDFMREIGVHFNVNKMLSSDIYAKRLANGGLTFFEMGYMLMQAYDFVYLHEHYDCKLQWGGADQWGNIIAGVDLGRKLDFNAGKERSEYFAATNPLLLTPEGKKMGKTEKGALWISKDKISAFDFYQGLYQTPDACVEMMFALFTDIPMPEIRDMIATDIVKAKHRMAFEITKFVRGESDALQAQKMSENLFVNGGDDAPTMELQASLFETGINITDLLVLTKLCASKSEARRMIEGGGITMKNEKVTTFEKTVTLAEFDEGGLLLKKGKKSFIKVVLL